MADNSDGVKIKITADADNAVSAISRVIASLKGVRMAVVSVMRTLGLINWAVQAVVMLYEGFKKLHEWINRAATAARELQERLRDESIATSIAHAAEAYKKLNKEIAEANRLEKERNSILDKRKSAARDIEDANLELDKAKEIASLDANSDTYSEDKAAIERKYAKRAAEIEYSRKQEDADAEARRLYDEADRKEREANDVQKVADRQWKNEQRLLDVSREKEYAADRSGSREDRENAEKAHKEWEKAYDAAKATEEAAEKIRQEAESLRRQGGEIMGSPGARQRLETAKLKIDTEGREQAARKAKEAARQAKDEQEKSASEAYSRQEAEIAMRREEEIAALDVNSESYDEDKAAIKRKYKRMELEAKRASLLEQQQPQAPEKPQPPEKPQAPEKPQDQRNSAIAQIDAELAALENEERRAAAKRAAKEAAEADKADEEERQSLASALEAMMQRTAAAGMVSGNRLNAMGLGAGSGVDRVQDQMANSLKELVRLGQQQIAEIKAGNIRAADNVAVYGD